MQAIFYDPLPGCHIRQAITEALTLAAKHGRIVILKFNDSKLRVNRRLSVKHLLNTWQHMTEAASMRYRRSDAYAQYKLAMKLRAEMANLSISGLLASPPESKAAAMPWLAEYVRSADTVGVECHIDTAKAILLALGFTAGQHVGAPEFKNQTASFEMKAEYIAGQAIDYMEHGVSPHPAVGSFAAALATEWTTGGNDAR